MGHKLLFHIIKHGFSINLKCKAVFFYCISEPVGKPSSVVDGYLSRRGIAPCAQAAFRNTPGRRIVTVSVAPNRVYRVLTFP